MFWQLNINLLHTLIQYKILIVSSWSITLKVLLMTMRDVEWLLSYITVHVELSVPHDIYEYKSSLALVTFGYDHTVN